MPIFPYRPYTTGICFCEGDEATQLVAEEHPELLVWIIQADGIEERVMV